MSLTARHNSREIVRLTSVYTAIVLMLGCENCLNGKQDYINPLLDDTSTLAHNVGKYH